MPVTAGPRARSDGWAATIIGTVELGRELVPGTFGETLTRFGAYLRIVEEGDVGAGDVIEVEVASRAGITVHELGASEHPAPDELIERMLADPEIRVSWKAWAQRQQRRSRG